MADEDEKTMGSDASDAQCRCWIYKGSRRQEMYLYLAEEDGFDAAPNALIEKMGKLQLVMTLDLHPGRPLARADVAEIMRALNKKGYYLQLPPIDMPRGTRLQ